MILRHELVAISFPTQSAAAEVAAKLAKAASEELVEIGDATIVVRDQHGTIRMEPFEEIGLAGLVGGSLTGFFAGSLLAMPIAGALIGGATGATVGGLADADIEEDFVREIGSSLEPGTSALFVLVEKAQGERGLATLRKHGGKVLKTSLPEWKEEKLRDLLGS